MIDHSPLRILIVDDWPEHRQSLRQALLLAFERKIDFTEAATGEEALALECLGEAERPDVMLLDVNLPDLNAFEVLEELSERHGRVDLPVVTLTSTADDRKASAALEAGAQDFFDKSHLEPQLLTRVVRNSIDRFRLLEKVRSSEARFRRFLAHMSHEIRTPMTAIMGYTDLLNAHLDDPDELQYVGTIKKNGEYLVEIIDDILDLSKIEAGRLELDCRPFSLPELIEGVASLMSVRARESSLPLYVDYDDALPETIESDPLRLRQVLVNLMGNAIKFTNEGEVRLQVSAPPDEPDTIVFEVIDTGIGMTREEVDRLFTPFEQADVSVRERFGGTGLGLAISKRLVDRLGGDIEVESEPGVGSTFRFWIESRTVDGAARVDPRGSSTPPAESAPPSDAVSLDAKVLVVDDQDEIRRLIERHLREAGAEVSTAVDGHQVLERLDQGRLGDDTFDVILMDMQMPGVDGYTTARRLRQAGFEAPIIAVTAAAMKGDRRRSLGAGCDDYVPKPIDYERLLAGVKKWSERSSSKAKPAAGEAALDPDPDPLGVLIVDDNPDLVEATQILLEGYGFRVETVQRGRDALEVAGRFLPAVILVDIGLPDIDGLEVARRLRQQGAASCATIIAMTGLPPDESAAAEHVDHVVRKPVDIANLVELFPERRASNGLQGRP